MLLPAASQYTILSTLTSTDLAGGKPQHPGALRPSSTLQLWGEAGATAGSILVCTLINAAGRNLGAWAEAAALCLMLP